MPIAERFQGANMIDAGRRSPYWGEHVARYRFALEYVDAGVVMDIACGTGYGIGMLAGRARYVVGVDVDAAAAREARGHCGVNAAVLLGDGLRLAFADGTFDTITTLETIEHLNDRRGFVDELARVLKPAGTLILSTPNANFTQPVDGRPENPFHIHEYTPDELVAELERRFSIDQMLGQSLAQGTGISPFIADQRRLPADLLTQARLFGWRVMNKLPYGLRESLSEMIWRKPFYPTEMDYNFSERTIDTAPTLVVVCKKK